MPVHSSTVADERFWSILAGMIPRAVTNFTHRYFEVIAILFCDAAEPREGWVERGPNALAALCHDPAEVGDEVAEE